MTKKITMIGAIFVYILLVAFSKNDNNSSEQITTTPIINNEQVGQWRITYFHDSDKEETHHFSGYAFSFNEGGSLVAVKNSTTIKGTWSVSESDSSDDDDGGSSDKDFNIFFSSPDHFEDLSDDWDIISMSKTKVQLIDVSGGNGGTDFLTFEKL